MNHSNNSNLLTEKKSISQKYFPNTHIHTKNILLTLFSLSIKLSFPHLEYYTRHALFVQGLIYYGFLAWYLMAMRKISQTFRKIDWWQKASACRPIVNCCMYYIIEGSFNETHPALETINLLYDLGLTLESIILNFLLKVWNFFLGYAC